jgi:hypothetical protein
LIADLAACEKDVKAMMDAARETEDKMDALKARLARLVEAVEALADYCSHQMPCLLAQWHEGRPTSDGHYETRYGSKWYRGDDKPPCTCGLDAALAEAKGGTP